MKIHPLKTIRDVFNTSISSDELKKSECFINWALANHYNLFDLAFDQCKMSNAIECYKVSISNENNNNI